jgi:hypothetical protein
LRLGIVARAVRRPQRERDRGKRAKDVVRDSPRKLLELGYPLLNQLLVAFDELCVRTHSAKERDRAHNSDEASPSSLRSRYSLSRT